MILLKAVLVNEYDWADLWKIHINAIESTDDIITFDFYCLELRCLMMNKWQDKLMVFNENIAKNAQAILTCIINKQKYMNS